MEVVRKQCRFRQVAQEKYGGCPKAVPIQTGCARKVWKLSESSAYSDRFSKKSMDVVRKRCRFRQVAQEKYGSCPKAAPIQTGLARKVWKLSESVTVSD
ncbi:hypothetical protein [Bacillus sp. B15-48]|uniref:hypothetical protein n=1 Tax=Bacillus sp. B15-48 TaxID=1548601 RepID=UPI00193F1952|nr:hypothetical protein [Bacillus sp. B15-48]MBM4761048.1 hypothetical protein [Bacillus sp. B15-48]